MEPHPVLPASPRLEATAATRPSMSRIRPHLHALLAAAARALAAYRFQGALRPDDLTPEEVVGETLLRVVDGPLPADDAAVGPALLALQRDVLRALVQQHLRYRRRHALPLDAAVPVDPEDTREWFWDWQQGVHTTWDDVIGRQTPVDVEIPLRVGRSGTPPRRVMSMHDEFEMDAGAVGYALGLSVGRTARLLARRPH